MHQRKIQKVCDEHSKKIAAAQLWYEKSLNNFFLFSFATCPFQFFPPLCVAYGSCSLQFTCIESNLFFSLPECLSWSFHVDIRIKVKKSGPNFIQKEHSCAVVCLHLKLYLCIVAAVSCGRQRVCASHLPCFHEMVCFNREIIDHYPTIQWTSEQ